jgi:drug/metabolite transporter (DMT)-like permease
MTVMRICGVFFFALSAVCWTMGILTLSRERSIADPSGLGVSRAVGTFLPAMITLILGLWLFKKRSPRTPQRGKDRSRSKRRPVEEDD